MDVLTPKLHFVPVTLGLEIFESPSFVHRFKSHLHLTKGVKCTSYVLSFEEKKSRQKQSVIRDKQKLTTNTFQNPAT